MFGAGTVDRQDVVTGTAGGGRHVSAPSSGRSCAACARPGWRPSRGLQISQRKPEWLRVPVRMGKEYLSLGKTVHDLGLATVCEEAGCPNIYECWSEGTATFMINGERCTRACGFCQVDTRHPLPLARRAGPGGQAVERMGLGHAVVTCVARDDLADGGAGAMAQTITAIRERAPGHHRRGADLGLPGRRASLDLDLRGPARRAQPQHRDGGPAAAGRAAVGRLRPQPGRAGPGRAAGLVTKSGLMVGLGEREDEVVATMADLRGVGVSIITIGQYLRPSRDHLPVSRYWTPEEFDRLKEIGAELGVPHVEASPLTRSSYHARDAAAAPAGAGYWMVAADGGVYSYDGAGFYGSAGGLTLNRPIVGMAATPTAGATGWWPPTAASSATATRRSTAHREASPSTRPIVGMAATPTAGATGWWPPTAASSATATPTSTARPGSPDPQRNRSSAWRPPPTAGATGWWPPTAASSATATRRFAGLGRASL
jgi:lipoate synthase